MRPVRSNRAAAALRLTLRVLIDPNFCSPCSLAFRAVALVDASDAAADALAASALAAGDTGMRALRPAHSEHVGRRAPQSNVNPRMGLGCQTGVETAIAAQRPFLGLFPPEFLWLNHRACRLSCASARLRLGAGGSAPTCGGSRTKMVMPQNCKQRMQYMKRKNPTHTHYGTQVDRTPLP